MKKQAFALALACLLLSRLAAQEAAPSGQAAGPAPSSPGPSAIPAVQPGAQAGAGALGAAIELPVLGLDELVAMALDKGADFRTAARTLDAARAAHALNRSKDELALAATASYGLSSPFSISDPDAISASLVGKAGGSGSTSGLSQAIQAGLTLSKGNASSANPFTRVALTASQSLPPPGSTTASPSTSFGLSVAQTVWDGYPGGQTKALIDKSLLALKGKELQATLARATAIAAVKRAYITMLSAQRTLALRQEIAQKQRAILAQIQAIYAIRQASSIDLQSAQINSRSADLDVETSRHDLALAMQRLANLAGLASDSSFRVAELPDSRPSASSLDEAIALGLARRNEIALADLNRQSSMIDLALAKGQSEPGLSLTGGLSMALGSYSSSVARPADAEYASLGLRLTLPVLDGGAAAAQVASGQSLVDLYATQLQQQRLSIAADIRDAWWLLDIQAQKVDLARQGMALYEAQLALVRTQNSFGTATNQDLMNAAVNAANAEAAYATAKNSYLLAVLALETAMGL
jgi:outer membrane protein